jgi:nitrate reductase alpha subunit
MEKPINISRHVAKIQAHQKDIPESSDWWNEQIAWWQSVRARGESLRNEHDKQSKIEAEARRVAAGIDGDHTYLLELCGNWPGQEMAFFGSSGNDWQL